MCRNLNCYVDGMLKCVRLLFTAALPLSLFATVSGLPVRRTGAPADGGLDCSACHKGSPPVNQGPGRITIRANSYNPGATQSMNVTVEDNAGLRFGFQLTARFRNDANPQTETRQAGSFSTSIDSQVLCDPDGKLGPCNGALEFASHTPDSTKAGSPTPRTFVLNWTPPGRDAGDVVFYAAGVAANNDNTENGDRVYTASVRISSAGCNLTGTPVIRSGSGIVDAAAFRDSISSNALITLFGSGFALTGAAGYKAVRGDLTDGKLPLDLACVAVEIGGRRVPVFYVQGDQINAQAPALDNVSSAQVRIILNPGTPNEIRSDLATVRVQPFSPALFTLNGKSIAALNGSNNNRILADPSVVPGGVPAKPGDVVVLYGTGFGATNPAYQTGEFATGPATLRTPVTIMIGGVTADVLYQGLSPDAPGFYQFNVRVPAAVPDGDAAVVMQIGSIQTQSGATIPIKR